MARSPAAARRRLGLELRRLRERAGKRLDEAADVLDCSSSKVSRLETGKGIPRARDVRDLLDLYGTASDDEVDELIALAADGRGQGWWDPFRKDLDANMIPDHLVRYVALETDAVELHTYQPEIVPGLLQTRDYAAAIIDIYFPERSPEQRARLVDFRISRQRIFEGETAPKVAVVMGEAALQRRIGSPAVLVEQFKSLSSRLEKDLSHVDFRIAPLSLATPAALSGPFSILTFPDTDDDDVVYVEGSAGATYVEIPGEVAGYESRFSTLIEKCLGRAESVERVVEVGKGDW